ncbi:MAG: tRNA (adenosine(37)-N6)-threonylcarbamoyltransferase complex dimerization subunit type 1 TsaB [Pseudomonadota bacterium]
MSVLAINTAQASCDVAITASGGEVFRLTEILKTGQDAALPGMVETLLVEAGLALTNLSRIGVCVGPGSFTGVRIGVAYARGLALTLGVPCVGVTSLQACLRPEQGQSPVRVALQAKKRPPDLSFWTQGFDGDHLAASPPEEWALKAVRESTLPVVTDAPNQLPDAAGTAAPSAENIALWAAHLTPDDAPPSPAYVRPPGAALPKAKG